MCTALGIELQKFPICGRIVERANRPLSILCARLAWLGGILRVSRGTSRPKLTCDARDKWSPTAPARQNNHDVLVCRDQDAVDRLRGHDSLVVGHRQVSQHAESRSQSVIIPFWWFKRTPFGNSGFVARTAFRHRCLRHRAPTFVTSVCSHDVANALT